MKNIFTKIYLFTAGLVFLLVCYYIAITTPDYMAVVAPTNTTQPVNLLSRGFVFDGVPGTGILFAYLVEVILAIFAGLLARWQGLYEVVSG